MNLTKVIIYSRVSTTAQTHTDAVKSQIQNLKDYAQSMNYEVVRIFSDSISGFSEEREELNDLLEYIKTTPVDFVLINEVSRLGRSPQVFWNNIQSLHNLNCYVYIHTPSPILTKDLDPVKTLQLNMMTMNAQFEHSTTKIRVTRGTARKGLLGSATGGLFTPYGYKSENKKLVIDETESEIIKRIFEMSLNGMGNRKIAKILNEEKIPTRAGTSKHKRVLEEGFYSRRTKMKMPPSYFKFNGSTIQKILQNEIYKGNRTYAKKVYKIDSIIPESIFDLVRDSMKKRQYQGREAKHFYYLIQNRIKCGICEEKRNYIAIFNRRNMRYVCSSKRNEGNQTEMCSNLGIGIWKLTSSIWYTARHSTFFNSMMNESDNITEYEKKQTELIKQIELIHKEYKEIEQRKKRLDDGLEDGGLSKEEWSPRVRILSKKRDDLHLAETQLKLRITEIEETIKDRQEYRLKVNDVKEDKNKLREMLNKLVVKVVIYPVMPIGTKNDNNKIYIELYTIYNEQPICYVIFQRDWNILYVNPHQYNKYTNELAQRKNNKMDDIKICLTEDGVKYRVKK
jgi:site-specific DNA recombinase